MATAARFLGSLATSFALVIAPLLGCSQGAATTGEAPPPASAVSRGVVIAQVVTHDAKVAIVGGGPDLRVVVRKLDGTLVADGVTLDQLRTQEPELYEVVTSSFASAGGHTYVDATLGAMN